MTETDNRQIPRDSLFILAELRLDAYDAEHRVKVRNLSAGGMMGEGNISVTRGTMVWVKLRNVGWVAGTVAWVQDNRFGVAFVHEIDHKSVQAQGAAVPSGDMSLVSGAVQDAPLATSSRA